MDVGTLAMVATSRYYLVSYNILIIHTIHQLIVCQVASIHVGLVHLHLSEISGVHHVDVDH